MDKKKLYYFEFFSWLISIAIALIFLIPIKYYAVPYPFYLSNFIFVICFLNLLRWLFLWRFSPYAWNQYLKAGIILISAALVFYLIAYFSDFRGYLVDVGLQDIVQHLDIGDQENIEAYIRTEMVFFGVGSIICGFCLPFRMLASIWTQHNRGYV